LAPCDDAAIIAKALESLARITGLQPAGLERVYFHNWRTDVFARGAYSYVPAGALECRRKLAEPVEQTLYIAGEATDLHGQSATVHGAIATGKRAAQKILHDFASGHV
jgi:monoamine oxidase